MKVRRRTTGEGWRTDGGWTEDRRRTDGGRMEDGRRTDGGRTEDGRRTDIAVYRGSALPKNISNLKDPKPYVLCCQQFGVCPYFISLWGANDGKGVIVIFCFLKCAFISFESAVLLVLK